MELKDLKNKEYIAVDLVLKIKRLNIPSIKLQFENYGVLEIKNGNFDVNNIPRGLKVDTICKIKSVILKKKTFHVFIDT